MSVLNLKAIHEKAMADLASDIHRFVQDDPELCTLLTDLEAPEQAIADLVAEGQGLDIHSKRSLAIFVVARLDLRGEKDATDRFLSILKAEGARADRRVEAALDYARDPRYTPAGAAAP